MNTTKMSQQMGFIELTPTHSRSPESKKGHTKNHNDTKSKGKSLEDNVGDDDQGFGYFLLEAAKNGNPEELENLLRDGATANVVDTFGRSPLHLAVSLGCSCVACVHDAEACVALLLTSNGLDVNLQDEIGNTALHLAVDNQLTKCTEMLISYGADVTIKSDCGEDAVRLMARKMPNCLIYLLNESIYVDQYDPHHEKCLLKVDFRPIIGQEPKKKKHHKLNSVQTTRQHYSSKSSKMSNSSGTQMIDKNFGREMELLMFLLQMCKYSGEKILSHPVIEIFLYLKWRRVRKVFWASFFCYMFWVILYTCYILQVYVISCPCEFFTRNRSDSNPNGQIQESAHHCQIETGFSVKVVIIIVSTFLLLLTEIGRLIITPRLYCSSWLNLGNWILIVLVFCTTIPNLIAQTSISAIQYQTAAFTVFLVWTYVLPQIGRVPSLAKYVEIFGHVLRCFGSFILTFASIYIAFSLAFWILFVGGNSPFAYFTYSSLKVFVMMVGEVDYQDMFYSNDQVSGPVMGHLLYALFVIVVCIVLMNLFVGLTVNDIQTLERQAEFSRICRLIIEIFHMESAVLSKRIPKQLRKLLYSVFSLSIPGWTYSFRPNSRDDKSIPQHLGRDALHLAEISFRKSRSQRCSKGQFDPEQNPELVEVQSYFSHPHPSASSISTSQSSSPLETNSLDINDLGNRPDPLSHLRSWNSTN